LSFEQGIAETVRALRDLESGISELPGTGIPKELRDAAREDLDAAVDILTQEDFFRRRADLSTRRTGIESRVANAVADMQQAQAKRMREAEGELALLSEWSELTAEEQTETLAEIQSPSIQVPPDIAGLKRLVSRQFDIDAIIAETKAKVVKEGKTRRHATPVPSPIPAGGMRDKGQKTISLPARIRTVAELDALIRTLSDLRHEISNNVLDLVVKGD
jgi:hypothetical protein